MRHDPTIHVEALPPQTRQDTILLRARVSGHPRRRKRNGTFFFEVPQAISQWLSIRGDENDVHDAVVRATVFSAMEAGRDLVIHGNVSTSLLDGLEVYQAIVANWWPRYHSVNVKADCEISLPARKGGAKQAILAYSGGLDSMYSLFRHQHGLQGRNNREILACVFVHGFDIPLDDDAFDKAFTLAERVVMELGSRLVPVRSNLKELLPPWPQTHAAALAATLSLFGRGCSEALIAPSARYANPYMHLSGHGSSPVSDHLLSSDTFRIVHDLADKSRVEKTEILRGLRLGCRNIRVCWEGQDHSTNCGRCNKCLWQMLCMKAVGIGDFSAFQQRLDPRAIAEMDITSQAHLEEFRDCHAYAVRAGLEWHDEFQALRRAIDRSMPDREARLPSGSVRNGTVRSFGPRLVNKIRERLMGPRTKAA